MNKIVILSSVVTFAALVGCRSTPAPAPAPVVVTPPPAVVTTPPPAVVTTPAPAVITTPAPAVVVPESAVRPGFGRVESIAAAPSSTAAAGGATMRRLSIKMEDGTLQLIDTPAGNIALGDRVELTSDGRIRYSW